MISPREHVFLLPQKGISHQSLTNTNWPEKMFLRNSEDPANLLHFALLHSPYTGLPLGGQRSCSRTFYPGLLVFPNFILRY